MINHQQQRCHLFHRSIFTVATLALTVAACNEQTTSPDAVAAADSSAPTQAAPTTDGAAMPDGVAMPDGSAIPDALTPDGEPATDAPATGGGPAVSINAAVSGTTATLVTAGDIATCSTSDGDAATAKLVDAIPGTVAALGDNAYPDGSASNYRCYDATWGRFKSRTRPIPGNHEYHASGAAPYFSYFGSRAGSAGKGWYSYDVGNWHIVALNSEKSISEQATWLKADLAAHRTKCTLAYWHQPLYTSGSAHGPYTATRPLFQILYAAGAEIVLGAHNHNYERFAPQNADGRADATRGVRQFVVGTGGAELRGFGSAKPNSEKRYSSGYGVLKLTLSDGRYDWKFVSVAGKTFTDSGSGACH
jgi:hypothetical protein